MSDKTVFIVLILSTLAGLSFFAAVLGLMEVWIFGQKVEMLQDAGMNPDVIKEIIKELN